MGEFFSYETLTTAPGKVKEISKKWNHSNIYDFGFLMEVLL